MRRQHGVRQAEERARGAGLLGEDVHPGARQPAVAQGVGEGGLIDHLTTGGVDDDRVPAEQPNRLGIKHVGRLRVRRDVEGDDIGVAEQRVVIDRRRAKLGEAVGG